jgi:hypothetical protein
MNILIDETHVIGSRSKSTSWDDFSDRVLTRILSKINKNDLEMNV